VTRTNSSYIEHTPKYSAGDRSSDFRRH